MWITAGAAQAVLMKPHAPRCKLKERCQSGRSPVLLPFLAAVEELSRRPPPSRPRQEVARFGQEKQSSDSSPVRVNILRARRGECCVPSQALARHRAAKRLSRTATKAPMTSGLVV